MIFEFLTACEKSPSLISGAALRRLEKQGLIGNAWNGGSDILVVEADESDGTLVKYCPEAAVILNVLISLIRINGPVFFLHEGEGRQRHPR